MALGERYKHMTSEQLLEASRSKYKSATTLLEKEQNEDAVYLAGYALEFILKRHIALSLGWETYPPQYGVVSEEGYKQDTDNKTFQTHDINKLFVLSGLDAEIASDKELNSHRDIIYKWQVELRYCSPGDLQTETAKEITDSIVYMVKWVKEKHD